MHVNYSELLQLAKGWGNFVSNRINIWRLRKHSIFYGCRLVEMVCFPHFGFVKMTVPVQRKIRFSAGFPV